MITNFKIFENKEDWKIGDIVIALEDKYDIHARWLIKDRKYKIIEVKPDKIKIEDLNGEKFYYYYSKNLFTTEYEYDSKKYNL